MDAPISLDAGPSGSLSNAEISSLDAAPKIIDASEIDASGTTGHGQQTARIAIKVLLDKQLGFHEPTPTERDALLVGFAMQGQALPRSAFDMIRLSRPVNLSNPAEIAGNMDAVTIYEIKSTNRKNIKADLRGYFFNITGPELLAAQALGAKFRFAFVNTLTRDYEEMTLTEVFARSRGMYPAYHIKF